MTVSMPTIKQIVSAAQQSPQTGPETRGSSVIGLDEYGHLWRGWIRAVAGEGGKQVEKVKWVRIDPE